MLLILCKHVSDWRMRVSTKSQWEARVQGWCYHCAWCYHYHASQRESTSQLSATKKKKTFCQINPNNITLSSFIINMTCAAGEAQMLFPASHSLWLSWGQFGCLLMVQTHMTAFSPRRPAWQMVRWDAAENLSRATEACLWDAEWTPWVTSTPSEAHGCQDECVQNVSTVWLRWTECQRN